MDDSSNSVKTPLVWNAPTCDRCGRPDWLVVAPPTSKSAIGALPGICTVLTPFCPLRTFELNIFFGVSPFPRDFIGDPEIIFDPQSDRWFASVFDQTTTNGTVTAENSLVAVSTSNNPNGTWNIYRFPAANMDFPDQASIGVSGDKFVISTNNFQGNTFKGTEFFVVMKQDMMAGVNPLQTYDNREQPGEFGMVPLHNASPVCINSVAHSCPNDLYMARDTGNAIVLNHIYGALPHIHITSNDPFSTVNLGPATPPCPMPQINSLPSGAVQKGTNTLLAIADPRLHAGGMPFITSYTIPEAPASGAISQIGIAFQDGCTPSGDTTVRACIRLIVPGGFSVHNVEPGSPERRYECGQPELNYEIAGPPGTSLFFPSMSVDKDGNWDIMFGFSSSNDFPSLGFTVLPRVGYTCHSNSFGSTCVAVMASSPEPFITLIQGTANDTSHRYGDYFQTTTYPSDPSFVYTGGEVPLCVVRICPHSLLVNFHSACTGTLELKILIRQSLR